jgi:fructose-1,6-bisphosphatase/sedoheptulose 1,7-bisphosphatase-like protein
MDQGVVFRPLPDDGGAEGAAVNRGIGADLDIVMASGGKKTGSTLAKATRALGTRMRTLLDETKGPATRMAAAWLCSAAAK